jgi:hypothetical protein
MKLLDALVEVVESQQMKGIKAREDGEVARLAYFAFIGEGDVAYLSELELDELVPLLEDWCKNRRVEMGRVN